MILSLRDIRKHRPQAQGEDYTLVVPELTVRAGEKILITGPSGSGKSTLLDLLGMVLRPDTAAGFLFSPVRRGGEDEGHAEAQGGGQNKGQAEHPHGKQAFDIAQAWRDGRTEELALWRRHIGYVLQTGGLLPFLSVRENITLPRRLLDLPEGRVVTELAEELNIAPLLRKFPAQLSVGERQRAAIARALAAEPALVLADEPTAALDPEHSEAVADLFMRMVSSRGLTLIFVTHAPERMLGKGFRHLHILQQGQGTAGREAVLSPVVGDNFSSGDGDCSAAPATRPEERIEKVPQTVPERDLGTALAENAADVRNALSAQRPETSLPEEPSAEEEPTLADLASLAALARISGMGTPGDILALTDDKPLSAWKLAQASWRGIEEVEEEEGTSPIPDKRDDRRQA